MELVLGRSPGVTSRVEVRNELTAKFHELEELCSWIKGPSVRIYNRLLVPSPGHAHWANPLEEVASRLEVAMARQCRANSMLEALWASTALVQDLILGNTSRSSSSVASLAEAAREVENWTNTVAANGTGGVPDLLWLLSCCIFLN
jgi:hypothetical protein